MSRPGPRNGHERNLQYYSIGTCVLSKTPSRDKTYLGSNPQLLQRNFDPAPHGGVRWLVTLSDFFPINSAAEIELILCDATLLATMGSGMKRRRGTRSRPSNNLPSHRLLFIIVAIAAIVSSPDDGQSKLSDTPQSNFPCM